jgi:ABC-type phosphate transport system substrate-binding protein
MRLSVLLLASLLLAASALLPRTGGGRGLAVAGSTTLMPLAERAAVGFADGPVGLYAVGTFSGASLLQRGLVDVALADVALPLPRRWRVVLGQLPVPVLVHCGLPVRSVRGRALAAVLSGRLTNWRALGGPEARLVVFFRTAASGLGAAIRARLIGDAPLGWDVVRLQSNGEVVRAVAETKGALGFADPGAARGCRLAVDGRSPGQRGYPLTIPVYAYRRAAGPELRAELDAFLARLKAALR